ncbi:putative signal transduction histidine kinase [Planktothrix sp. PCC 11201]|uniref:ATP-binding protein n=1 Tax=Planktothrix sp. PCC 11201 TaxID=1729650 RepID=UPI00091346A7|nr:ATP-binding protein [Planktothrix sp. PCC 11201]SKB15654.1 putative signal transduction histidine kinase [Planktothrix sp. PCC 11201]
MKLFNQQVFRYQKSESFRLIVINICLGIAYLLGVKFSINVTSVHGSSAIWLPAGMVLAAVILFGSKVFPAIAFGSIVGLIDNHSSIKSFTSLILINVACILANYLQPLFITLLLKKYTNIKNLFNSINGVITFFILSCLLVPILPPLLIVNTAVYIGFYSAETYWNSFFTMWASSALGHVIFTPLFLIPTIRPVPGANKLPPKIKLSIIGLVSIGTIVVLWITFIKNISVEYIFLLLLILTVFTLGKKFSIVMVAIVSSVSIIATALGFGPFVKASPNQSLFLVQLFIGVFAVTSLILSAIIDEKQKATNKLELTLANLEDTVKERTLQLEKAKEKAEVANQAKSIFIANMSHELRSPLNAILGFSQIMLRTPNLPLEHLENAGIIYRSGEYLLTMINNILDFSKIEAGKTTLNLTHFDLYQLLDDLEDMLHLRSANAGLNLIFERDPSVPQYIYSDQVKLRQVLINLLSNGIKFTPEGGVTLMVLRRETPDTDSALLEFHVRDTGVGISPQELPKLFQVFTQAQAGKESQEGTGLGLAISQKFVQLMGGEIQVESQLHQGTTFRFQIRVQRGQNSQDKPTEAKRIVLGLVKGQPTYKLLTVDDKEVNRKLLIKLLQPLGFEVKEARNGLEAIAIWNQWEPHLIWMDMRMPVMDGYEAIKYIKSTTKGNATAVIALTASVLEEEKAIVLSAGCDDFIRKPFTEHNIFETLTKHLGVRYIYSETKPSVSDINLDSALTSQQLTCMPKEWIVELYQATLEANTGLVMQLITQIPHIETHLIQSLTQLVRKFEFEQIIKLIEPLVSHES